MFTARGFADDAAARPAQFAEVYCQRDSCKARRRGRTTSFADGNLVLDVERQRLDRFAFLTQHLAIGGQDEMVLHTAANFGVSSLRADGKFIRGSGSDFQEQPKGQRSGIECRAEISGGGRQHELQLLL